MAAGLASSLSSGIVVSHPKVSEEGVGPKRVCKWVHPKSRNRKLDTVHGLWFHFSSHTHSWSANKGCCLVGVTFFDMCSSQHVLPIDWSRKAVPSLQAAFPIRVEHCPLAALVVGNWGAVFISLGMLVIPRNDFSTGERCKRSMLYHWCTKDSALTDSARFSASCFQGLDALGMKWLKWTLKPRRSPLYSHVKTGFPVKCPLGILPSGNLTWLSKIAHL